MLLIMLYFLFVILLAVSAIWMYRNLPWRKGFTDNLVGRVETYPKMTLRSQQGFITLETRKRKSTQVRRRRRERMDALRTPWGW